MYRVEVTYFRDAFIFVTLDFQILRPRDRIADLSPYIDSEAAMRYQCVEIIEIVIDFHERHLSDWPISRPEV